MHTLTDDQRRLVRDNLGLVGVHLRRHVRGLDAPRRHREWEDLFQEGCLGLMRAAVAFDPARGIPFAAFALPRIHNAVSCALEEKFSMFASPKRRRRRPGGADSKRSTRPDRSPRIRSLSDLPIQYSRSRRQNPTERPAGETVGDRLRDKYVRAVRNAVERVQESRAGAREDRPALIRQLAEERLLVAQRETRKALRQIARETGSSYARVAQCEQRMLDMVRERLSIDPEVAELQRRARQDPVGLDRPLDATVEVALANASAAEFLRKFRDASAGDRSTMLERLLDVSPQMVGDLLSGEIAKLPSEARERVLQAR